MAMRTHAMTATAFADAELPKAMRDAAAFIEEEYAGIRQNLIWDVTAAQDESGGGWQVVVYTPVIPAEQPS